MATRPTQPILGVPTGMKQNGQRVDFRSNQFDLAIETKGYLLAWERANQCPCTPVTSTTEQPDPNCTVCKGRGWFYTGAPVAQDLSDYTFDDLQQSILDENGAMVIRGLITRIEQKRDPLDTISNWVKGAMNLSVRNENRIAYYDKITALDSQIVFNEIVTTDGTAELALKYKAAGVNELRSTSKVYVPDTDFELSTDGKIAWLGTPPLTDIRLTAHYLCHPTWLVVEHPHAVRTTSLLYKTASPKTPTGDPSNLPIQAMVQYDFLRED